MEDFLVDLYKYANLIFEIKQTIRYSHYGYDSNIYITWQNLTETIVEFCQETSKHDPELGYYIYNQIKNATAFSHKFPSNYSQFADVLENLLPSLYKAISYQGNIDVDDEKYRIYSSKSGFLALSSINDGYNITSSIDPMWEAYEHASKIYNPYFNSFHIIGCELGYLPYQLYLLSNKSMDIHIYHLDDTLINYAKAYGVLTWIPNDKIHIHICNSEESLLREFSNAGTDFSNGSYIHPDVLHSMTKEYYPIIEPAYISNLNYNYWNSLTLSNAYRNLHNVANWLPDYSPTKSSTEWCVVAAGPSLDEQLPILKKMQTTTNIICVTTVFKKLLENNIIPDCIASNDPQNRTFNHFKDISSQNVPLLLSLHTNWQFSEYYTGPKFIVPTISDPQTDQILKIHNMTKINPGTTVSTMAIVIALYFKATRINLFGLDLSYPKGKTHASGTMDEDTVSTDKMIEITSVDNKTTHTTKLFKTYIDEIEKIILEKKKTQFINYSTNGAKLKGSIWYKNV